MATNNHSFQWFPDATHNPTAPTPPAEKGEGTKIMMDFVSMKNANNGVPTFTVPVYWDMMRSLLQNVDPIFHGNHQNKSIV